MRLQPASPLAGKVRILDGALAADPPFGEAGSHLADYTSRAGPVQVTLDGDPADGHIGENDNARRISRAYSAAPATTCSYSTDPCPRGGGWAKCHACDGEPPTWSATARACARWSR